MLCKKNLIVNWFDSSLWSSRESFSSIWYQIIEFTHAHRSLHWCRNKCKVANIFWHDMFCWVCNEHIKKLKLKKHKMNKSIIKLSEGVIAVHSVALPTCAIESSSNEASITFAVWFISLSLFRLWSVWVVWYFRDFCDVCTSRKKSQNCICRQLKWELKSEQCSSLSKCFEINVEKSCVNFWESYSWVFNLHEKA